MDIKFMAHALELAKKASEYDEIPVGCVIVKNGEVIGEGYNLRERDNDALAHAEILAIKRACESLKSWRLCNCELYVTLEPCPMCAGAVMNARIDTIVFGASDKKAGALGGVTNIFDHTFPHTPRIIGPVMEEESIALLRNFFKSKRK